MSRERVSSGVAALDEMLGGEGFYRGSTVLISGTAGTGKSSLSAHFAHASCARGETCLYFAFEESQDQILRNMRSIGVDLQPWLERKLLHFSCARPTHYGLEMHLATIFQAVRKLSPQAVIIDPISNLISVGSTSEVKGLLTRLIDFLKERQITTFFTNLTAGGGPLELTEVGISSLVDSWLLLRELEANGERNRGLYVLKSRGMAHSNQVREFLVTSRGIELADVYVGPEGILTGSARLAEDARRKAVERSRGRETERRRREIERRRKLLEAEIEKLTAEFQSEEEELERLLGEGTADTDLEDLRILARSRQKKDAGTETVPAAKERTDG